MSELKQEEHDSLRRIGELEFLIFKAEKLKMGSEYIGVIKKLREVEILHHQLILAERCSSFSEKSTGDKT